MTSLLIFLMHTNRNATLVAADVMRREYVYLEASMPASNLARIVLQNRMMTYPVINNANDRVLLGEAQRGEIMHFLDMYWQQRAVPTEAEYDERASEVEVMSLGEDHFSPIGNSLQPPVLLLHQHIFLLCRCVLTR